MAKSSAIAAVGLAIVDLLERARPAPAWTIGLYRSEDFGSRAVRTGASVYLYRVVPSGGRAQAPRPGVGGTPRRPPLLLDLHYLLTPWAESADTQHEILGWMLRTIEDSPVLSPGLLNGRVQLPVFGPDEAVALSLEPLSLEDTSRLWEVGMQGVPVSVAYVARVVRLDSTFVEEVVPRRRR